MIISDLNYQEDISEISYLHGGVRAGLPYPKVAIITINISQLATSKSTAFTFAGDAIANASSLNNLFVNSLIS